MSFKILEKVRFAFIFVLALLLFSPYLKLKLHAFSREFSSYISRYEKNQTHMIKRNLLDVILIFLDVSSERNLLNAFLITFLHFSIDII